MGTATTSCCKRCPSTARSSCDRRKRTATSQRNRRRRTTTSGITKPAATNNSSLNFRAQQKCLRSKLSPATHRARGFFVPLSPPEMNCLENDETDQCAATQSGCHGPALPAPPLFWFDIRRNMPHTDSLTFDVMSPHHTFQECQARSIRSPALLPQPPQCRPLVRERTY